jgi:hypothetical protein
VAGCELFDDELECLAVGDYFLLGGLDAGGLWPEEGLGVVETVEAEAVVVGDLILVQHALLKEA